MPFNSCTVNHTADYLIVITGRSLQGQLMGHDIYRATEFDILPLASVSAYIPPHPVEAHLLNLVRSHFNGGNFLFSYTWDLTRRLQAQLPVHEDDVGKAFYEVVRVNLVFVIWKPCSPCLLRWMIVSSGTSMSLCYLSIAIYLKLFRFLQHKFIEIAAANPNAAVSVAILQPYAIIYSATVWVIHPPYHVWKCVLRIQSILLHV